MIAMNGPTPTRAPVPPRSLAGTTGSISAPALASSASGLQTVTFPDNIPLPGIRPAVDLDGVAISAYASMRVAGAFAPFPAAGSAPGWKKR
jgi:hypothetical protein